MARCKFLCDHTSNVSWIHSNSNNQLCWKIQTPRTPLRETQGGNKTKMGPDNWAWWGIHLQSSHSLDKGENLMGKTPPHKREKHTCSSQCMFQTTDPQEWVITIEKTSYALSLPMVTNPSHPPTRVSSHCNLPVIWELVLSTKFTVNMFDLYH